MFTIHHVCTLMHCADVASTFQLSWRCSVRPFILVMYLILARLFLICVCVCISRYWLQPGRRSWVVGGGGSWHHQPADPLQSCLNSTREILSHHCSHWWHSVGHWGLLFYWTTLHSQIWHTWYVYAFKYWWFTEHEWIIRASVNNNIWLMDKYISNSWSCQIQSVSRYINSQITSIFVEIVLEYFFSLSKVFTCILWYLIFNHDMKKQTFLPLWFKLLSL